MALVKTKPGMQMYDNFAVRGTLDDGECETFELSDDIIKGDTLPDGTLKSQVAYELVDEGGKPVVAAGPNAKTVVASIPGLSDEALSALENTETEREDGGRATVLKAIEAEQAKRKDSLA